MLTEEDLAQIRELHAAGNSIKRIAKLTGWSRNSVRLAIRMDHGARSRGKAACKTREPIQHLVFLIEEPQAAMQRGKTGAGRWRRTDVSSVPNPSALSLEELVHVDRERAAEPVERAKRDVEVAGLDLLVVARHDAERLGRALLGPAALLAQTPEPCGKTSLEARDARPARGSVWTHRAGRYGP